MKQRLTFCLLLLLLAFGWFACTLYDTYEHRLTEDQSVIDAWERGQRAEERGEYQKAKEEYYFVKRFATTITLKREAQGRYEAVSRILEESEAKQMKNERNPP